MSTHPVRLLLCALALVILALGQTGCGDDSSASNGDSNTSTNNATDGTNAGTTPDTTGGCTEGFVGCDCIDGVACYPGSDWVCIGGTCRVPECAPGSEGCACYANNTCDDGPDGQALRCDEGLCVVPPVTCDAGDLGCACLEGRACNDALVCIFEGGRELCAPDDCAPGAEGCPCDEDRRCDGGLACAQNVCVASSCRPGAEDCFCRADLTCDDGLACAPEDERCRPILCTPGSNGCTCDAGDACDDPQAVCGEDGICAPVDCPPGTEGCACTELSACGVGRLGGALFCEGGVCRADDCTPGQAGCVCEGGLRCDAGAECVDGACLPTGCAPGQENCACDSGLCQPGLRCREDNLCVDGTGFINNACGPNDACERGSRCVGDLCRRCTLGAIGCQCDDADTCLPGAACLAGTCVAEQDLPPRPADTTRCFTPCRQGAEIDGVYVPCDADGLMEACLDGRECRDGSCLLPEEDAPACDSELDCPSWQTCIGGTCGSECHTDQECPSGKQCFNHICRVPCDSTSTPCPEGQHCLTEDGQVGACMPNHPAAGAPVLRVDGDFQLSDTTLAFTNNAVTRVLTIYNNSATFETFRITKRNHLLQLADGSSERAQHAPNGRTTCDPDLQPDCACADSADPDTCTCAGPECGCFDDGDCADPSYACRQGACRPITCGAGECPMFWMRMGAGSDPADAEVGESIEVGVEAGGRAEVVLTDTANSPDGVARWQGALDISHPKLGTQRVELAYNEVPEGQWAGEMVYLANFNTQGLEQWRQDQTTRDTTQHDPPLGNALLRSWVAFRTGRISYEEMQAVLTAVQTGSWKFANVQRDCDQIAPDGACYPYNISAFGLEVMSEDLRAFPVPTGVTELPFGLNLRQPDREGDPGLMEGRIESSIALHYAGDPRVELRFVNDPQGCDDTAFGACIAYLDTFSSLIKVGGRYLTDPSDTDCTRFRDGTYVNQREPWLVPGFSTGTSIDDATGQRFRHTCRDGLLPFTSDDAEQQALLQPRNVSLAASNPVPDGRARVRTFTILDGALINQSELLIFFEERFESFIEGQEGFSAYGFMSLARRSTDLPDDDLNANTVPDIYEGAVPEDDRPEPDDVLDPVCTPELLDRILGSPNAQLDAGAVPDVVSTLIQGIPIDASPDVIDADTDEQVHYFCEDTGLIDGGPDNATPAFITDQIPNNETCALALNGVCEDGGVGSEFSICALGTDRTDCGRRTSDDLDVRVECPVGSRVDFFTVLRSRVSQADIAQLSCQLDGTCQDQLNRWADNGVIVQDDPAYRCADPDAVFCDANRLNLRQGKTFFAATEQTPTFVQLQSLVDEAFRYKTRFQNRDGQGLGFAPEICIPDSDAVPYCYDPDQIQAIADRLDCLLHIHQNWYDSLSGTPNRDRARLLLDDALTTHFALTEERRPNLALPIIHDGFERQLSELMIMLGDDAYTRAFSSRFDLAQSSTASFDGTAFEPNGIDLSGAAGFEMVSLYQAAQYYQRVLDRFYTLSPAIGQAVQFGVSSRNFVTADTVLRYFDRVIRASTQKANAWAEIAKRYQTLNRPDLASDVIERTYTATYLESIIMSRVMLGVLEDATLAENRAQIERAIEDAQLRYKVALTDMQMVHASITDELVIFGFAPDYIPFPALDAQDFRQSNAFEVFLLRARNKIQFAREREETALNQDREFESNQAQFQSELTQIKNNYEGQLADICGTFPADDGDNDPSNNPILPAIRKYAHRSRGTSLLGEPCGLVGNGQLFQALAALTDLDLDAQALQVQMENTLEEIEIERERVANQCGAILSTADFLYGKCNDPVGDLIGFGTDPFLPPDRGGCVQAQINDLQRDIRTTQSGLDTLNRLRETNGNIAKIAACSAADGQCAAAGVSLGTYQASSVLIEGAIFVAESTIQRRQTAIDELERMKMKWQLEGDCDMAKIESEARVRTMLLRLREFDLEVLRLEQRQRLAYSEIERLRNQARRIEAQQAENEQLTINIQAAHNNPNVRIYKNDAIINAEIAFDDAIREVYKLTKVFEYYTSQSYARKDELFLIRMIARGDKNLENYLNALENAFYDFEEFFGQPSNRVHIVSLKNDILAVPLSDDAGRPYSESERTAIMRRELTDPARLDRNGYITLPFSTNLDQVSPLTRNHKLLYVEADIYGNDTGDLLGRVYLRQKGTSVINGVEDDKQYFRFDARTGVVNAIFGGVRFFENTIYQNHRHRDRPFVNTQWELVLNQRDELVNQDINLNALTDIRLYVYYTDFTVF